MRNRIFPLALAIALMCSLLTRALATSPTGLDAAEQLHKLGLFQGTGTNEDGSPNFDLDRMPTRTEGITMLVRLLDKEKEAKAGTWNTPFEDVPDWALPYVGYAYENGLTTGTGPSTFGSDSLISASQYLTLILRSLGYESGVDFQWDEAWLFSDEIGLTNGQYTAEGSFTRGDVAIVSLSSLSTPKKKYSHRFSGLSDSAVIIEMYDIVSVSTGKKYENASFTFKGSKYTNMANSYTLDEFFFSEFPEHKEEVIAEINRGMFSGVLYQGDVYLYDGDMIQFFRQYDIEFYKSSLSSNYEYIKKELPTSISAPTTEKVDYEISFSPLSENAVIIEIEDIFSKKTESTYSEATITYKGSKYTNMANGYYWDEFFFKEFPEYEYEIKSEVNRHAISGVQYNGRNYLDTVNMIQFFRQYDIEFYKQPSGDFVHTIVYSD